MDGNAISIEGNLVADPELREFTNARGPGSLARFSVARSFLRNEETEAHFFDCVIFGAPALNVMASLKKGDRVMVVGHLTQSKWETTNDDGSSTKRAKVEITATGVGAAIRWATVEITRNPRPDSVELEVVPEEVDLADAIGF